MNGWRVACQLSFPIRKVASRNQVATAAATSVCAVSSGAPTHPVGKRNSSLVSWPAHQISMLCHKPSSPVQEQKVSGVVARGFNVPAT